MNVVINDFASCKQKLRKEQKIYWIVASYLPTYVALPNSANANMSGFRPSTVPLLICQGTGTSA